MKTEMCTRARETWWTRESQLKWGLGGQGGSERSLAVGGLWELRCLE